MSARRASTGYRIMMRNHVSSLTLRLVGDYPEVPAGSVMRCVARAVRRALLASTPPEQIPTRAESAVREAMARRLVPSRGQAPPRPVKSRQPPRSSRRAG